MNTIRQSLYSLIGLLVLSQLTTPLAAEDPHLALNPVYKQIIENGITDVAETKLPSPTIKDDETDSDDAINSVVDQRMRERFFRPSVVAPHVVKLDKRSLPDDGKLRTIDFWFAVQATLDELKADTFLDSFRDAKREEDSQAEGANVLDQAELAERGISFDEEFESFAHAEQRLFKRLDLTVTNRSFWSQSEKSIVVASLLDDRFLGDKDFPNTWARLTRADDGSLTAGDPQPYSGAGGYLKITEVSAPSDLILVEGHFLFVEPHAWFRGANLLGSKMPALIQAEVRNMRKSVKQAQQN